MSDTANQPMGLYMNGVNTNHFYFYSSVRKLFTIKQYGEIEIEEGISMTEAAKGFWEAVRAMNPFSTLELTQLRADLDKALARLVESKDSEKRMLAILDRAKAECDAISDGAPDAAPEDQFANRLLGILNGDVPP